MQGAVIAPGTASACPVCDRLGRRCICALYTAAAPPLSSVCSAALPRLQGLSLPGLASLLSPPDPTASSVVAGPRFRLLSFTMGSSGGCPRQPVLSPPPLPSLPDSDSSGTHHFHTQFCLLATFFSHRAELLQALRAHFFLCHNRFQSVPTHRPYTSKGLT